MRTPEGKCPFGHEFGRDFEGYPDCDNCSDDLYATCGNFGEDIDIDDELPDR